MKVEPVVNIPKELKYTSDHEWARVEGTVVTVGVTDFAQSSLGDVVYLDLPSVGDSGVAGESLCEVESTKSVSDIHTPIDGPVVEINEDLDSEPGAINTDPYGDGWIFKVEITNSQQLDKLLDADAYSKHIS